MYYFTTFKNCFRQFNRKLNTIGLVLGFSFLAVQVWAQTTYTTSPTEGYYTGCSNASVNCLNVAGSDNTHTYIGKYFTLKVERVNGNQITIRGYRVTTDCGNILNSFPACFVNFRAAICQSTSGKYNFNTSNINISSGTPYFEVVATMNASFTSGTQDIYCMMEIPATGSHYYSGPITVTASTPQLPQIEVQNSTNNIISNNGSESWPNTININSGEWLRYRIYNRGNANLNISSVSVDNSNDFSVYELPSSSIAPNSYSDFKIACKALRNGNQCTNVTVNSNSNTNSSHRFNLCATVITPCVAPSTPSSLTASTNNCGYIALSWSASSGTSPTYNIYRNGAYIDNVSSTSYADYNAPSGNVTYQVEATNSCGTSGRASASGRKVVIPTCPIPNGLNENAQLTTADVTWNSTSDALNYTVFWRVLGTSNWSNSPSLNTTSHSITGLSVNTTYQWYVRANCNCIESAVPNSFRTIATTCLTIDGTISRGELPNSIPSVGDRVQFSFQGYRHATSISWTFPNATPATSNEATPTVVFNQAGTHIVRLTASNACGTVNKTDTIKIIDYSGAIKEFQLSEQQLDALDPIGIATGGYLHGERDLTLFGLNNLTFSRNYNSRQNTYNKAFGYGWHHNFEYWIDNTSNPDLLTVYHGDGHRVYYVKQPNGTTKLLYDDITDSLIINANATYTLLQRDGGKMNFDASGKATSIEDVFANTVTFGYTANNLTSITSAGRSFRLTYNNNNKIITLSDGQRTTYYGYHPSGDLAYAAIAGDTMRYTYNGNHELEQVQDPKGFVFVKNVYYNGRVIEQRDAYDTPHYLSYSTLADGTMITTVRDINNATTTAYHNDNFNLVKYIDELGKEQSMTHYANGALKTYTDQNRHTTDITRNAKGDPLSIKNHLQRSITTTFNNMGLPTGITDLLGTQTRLAYNQNRLDTMYLPNGTFIKMTYTPQGLTQNVKDPKGNIVETRIYNSFGDLIQTNTLTGNYYFGQDNLGRITSVRAGEDTRKTWTIEYNHRDQILKMTTPLGTFTQNIYDKNGYVTASKDLIGYWTYYEYDKRDRLIKITNAKRESTQLGYDLFDRLLFIKDNNNDEIWRATYNPRGEMIEELTPQYGKVQHRFDDAGRWLSSTNALNYSVSATYNELNLPTEVTNEQGYKTKMTYNDGNQTTKMTYPDGTDKQFAFHAMGWLNKVTDAIGGKNELFFDRNGNVDSVRNAKNNIVSTTYDVANRPLSSTDGITSVLMTWEQQGIKTVRDGNSITSTYNRDLNDRVTERTGTDNTFERLKLNADGVLDTLVNEEGAISVKRDSLHRPIEIKDIFGNTIKYSWTTIGQLATTEYPSGRIVERTYYRPSGLPKEVKLDGQVVIKYFYTLIGQLDSTWVLNGTTTKTYYNAAGVITRRLNRLPNGTIFQENNRQLDSMNQVKAELVAPVLSPLFTEGQTLSSHKIDDGLEQLNGVTVQSDGNGNIKSIGTAQTYTWKNNRLTAFNRNGNAATFSYDGFGTKVKRLQNGIETRYINDFIQSGVLATPIEERDGQNQVRLFTILGAFGEPILRDSGGTRSFYHFDTEGNTIALTNATATITDKYGADEFGAFANHTGSSTQPFRFMGAYGVQHEMEDLYYVRARWMDVAQGRFLSKDPYPADVSNTQSNNRFVYALNNAMTWVDPSGLYSVTVKLANFFLKHPDIAYAIGKNYNACGTDITDIATNFAINLGFNADNGFKITDYTDEGSVRNAFRHMLWQAIIAARFGSDIAKEAGDAHEDTPELVDFDITSFAGTDKIVLLTADQTVDLKHNRIGREISATNKFDVNTSSLDIAKKVLERFKVMGYYYIKKNTKDDTFNIKTKALTKKEYEDLLKLVNKLNNNGLVEGGEAQKACNK